MASSKSYLKYVLDRLEELDDISYRAMMGEYIIYYRDKVVGGVYDNRFLVKSTESSIKMLPNASLELPYHGAKKMLLIEDEVDNKFICKLIKKIYEELPIPKKK